MHPAPRSWFLKAILQGLMEKWLILGLDQEKHKRSREPLVVAESEEVLR